MNNLIEKEAIKGIVVHDLTCTLDLNNINKCCTFGSQVESIMEKKEGKEKMDKTIVSKWRNRKEEELRKELEEEKAILRRDDKAYREILAAIDKWKDELNAVSLSDIMSNSKNCIRAETQEKIAAIEKEYRDVLDALDRKVAMINAAMEFVNDYDSMKKVLEDFGVWKEIIK